MSKGVYILALGSPTYVQWAVNLAASVRYYSPALHITLLHDGCFNRLIDVEKGLFDSNEVVNLCDYTDKKGMFQPGKAKLNLYKYFKHDENLFIDADSICIDGLDRVFEDCKDLNVGLQVYNVATNKDNWACKWASWEQLKELYGIKDGDSVQEINSSIIYSKKNKEAKKFWDKAAKNFIENFESLWGKRFPDELAFDVATVGIDCKIKGSHDHYPVTMTSRINNENLTIGKLKAIAPIMSYWGGKSGNNVAHYRNYDLQANMIHRAILGKTNVYKYDFLVKDKLVVKDGIRLNVKPQIKNYE